MDETVVQWLYDEATTNNNSYAQNNLGFLYKCQNDYERAYKWCKISADQDNAIGQVNLAQMFLSGIYVNIDLKTAFDLNKSSSDKNNGYGHNALGHMYFNGNAKALYSIGQMYENGFGVKKNLTEALRIYKLAAENKHEESLIRVTQLFKEIIVNDDDFCFEVFQKYFKVNDLLNEVKELQKQVEKLEEHTQNSQNSQNSQNVHVVI